jgi:hypothetical protein
MDVDHTDTAGRNGPAENAGTHTKGAAKHQQHAQQQHLVAGGNTGANYAQRTGKQPVAPSHTGPGGTSSGSTSPERRAQSVPIDPSRIKLRQHPNRFEPLAEHNTGNSDAEIDKVREGSISDASRSKGSKRREPIPLTTHILQLLDKLEHEKGSQGKLLTEHLA